MTGIYKITSPTGKVYIGQTFDSRVRFGTYKRLDRASIGGKLYNSLKKYGVGSHSFAMIHTLPADVSQPIMNEYERLYISQYRDCGIELLNLTEGGEGSKGYKHTDEARKIMKAKAAGRIAGDKNPNYGKGLHGKDNPMYGKKRPKELMDKLLKSKQKAIVQYTLGGDVVAEYSSITEAARKLGLEITNISNVCLKRPECKTAGGFSWRFKGDPFEKVINKNFSPILQFTKNGEFIKEWSSIKEAMLSLGLGKTDPSHICARASGKGRGKTAYGFIWKYKSDTK
jgi:group I intron endonuclease